jgi:hypothetical protein
VEFVLQRYADFVYARDQEHGREREERGWETEDDSREPEEGSLEPEEDSGEPEEATGENEEQPDWRWGSREGEILGVQFLNSQGAEQKTFRTGDPLVARLHFDAKQGIEKPRLGLAFYHPDGCYLSGPNTVFSGLEIDAVKGKGYVDYVVDSLPFLEGTYLVSAAFYDYEGIHCYDFHHLVYSFRVRRNEAIKEKYGTFFIPSKWRLGC